MKGLPFEALLADCCFVMVVGEAQKQAEASLKALCLIMAQQPVGNTRRVCVPLALCLHCLHV